MPVGEWRHAWLVTLVWAMPTLSVLGQVQWSVDTTQIRWGEPVQLTAEWLLSMDELQSGLADASAWPTWKDTTSAGLEILSSSPIDTMAAPVESGQDIMLRKTWTLTSWDSGFVVMPPASFGPYETSPLLIRVLTPVLAEDAQPMPPADCSALGPGYWLAFSFSDWCCLHAFCGSASRSAHRVKRPSCQPPLQNRRTWWLCGC